MRCQFVRVSPAQVRCAVCDRLARFHGDPARLAASCRPAGFHESAAVDREFPCRHRGEVLRTVACQLCGQRDVRVEVHACSLHGECTLRRWRAGDRMPACLTCPDRACPAPESLILSCRLSPGDVLTLTAAVESLHATYPQRYLTDVRTPCPEIWQNNPHHTPMADDAGRMLELHYPSIHHSNRAPHAFLAGYTSHLGELLGVPLALTTNRPHVYLSPEERASLPDAISGELAGIGRPFWLVSAGVKRDFTAKQWPVEWYQHVVDVLAERVLFVQVGAAEHDHPRLRGTIDLRGKTTLRQLLRLAFAAQGGLGPITLLQHAMAAAEKPYVALVGGREPAAWVSYPQQATLHTVGQLDCCARGACWRSRVVALDDGQAQDWSLCERPRRDFSRPVAECMARITPVEVAAVIARMRP